MAPPDRTSRFSLAVCSTLAVDASWDQLASSLHITTSRVPADARLNQWGTPPSDDEIRTFTVDAWLRAVTHQNATEQR
jgi:hypothetical protein